MTVRSKLRPAPAQSPAPGASEVQNRPFGPGAGITLLLVAAVYAAGFPEAFADWASLALAALAWTVAHIGRRGDPAGAAVVLGGCVLGLAAPDRSLGIVAFAALVPFLHLGRTGRSLPRLILHGLAGGTAFGLGVGSWGANALAGYTDTSQAVGLLLYLPFALVFGARLALLPVLVHLNRRFLRLPPALFLPLSFAAAELLFPTLYPWYLAYTMPPGGVLSQMADLTGPIGLSALLVLCNVAVWKMFRGGRLWLRSRSRAARRSSQSVREARTFLAPALPASLAAAVLLTAASGYGILRRAQVARAEAAAPTLAVALIQPVTPSISKREDAAGRRRVAATLEQLATSATQGRRTDLIVFAESAAPMGYQFGYNPEFRALYEKLARRSGAAVLTENTSTRRDPDGRLRYWRGSLLLHPDGTFSGEYLKRRLVPFGEYLPLEQTFPALKRLFRYVRTHERGTTYPLIEAAGVRLVPQICFEMLDSAQVRTYVQEVSGQLLVNPVNDAWYRSEPQMRQHHALAAWRSIETRRPMVRVGNTGLSSVISATGRLVGEASPLGRAWSDLRHIPLAQPSSFFGRFGNAFAWTCLAAVAAMSGVALRRRGRG